jgi:hypothetical protein
MEITKTESGLYAVDVDGSLYEFAKWGAEKAMDTFLDITGIIGKPLSALMAAIHASQVDGAESQAITIDTAAAIAEQLTSNIGTHKKTCMAVIKRLTSGPEVFCDGKKVDFDTHYASRISHLFEVVRAAVEVQYGNFFEDALRATTGIRVVEKAKQQPAA